MIDLPFPLLDPRSKDTWGSISLDDITTSLQIAANNIFHYYPPGSDTVILLGDFDAHVRLHEQRIKDSTSSQQDFQEIAQWIRVQLLEDYRRVLEEF